MSAVRLSSVLRLVPLLVAAACAPAPGTAAAPAADPGTTLAPAAWTASSSPDSMAAWARRGCARPAAGKMACTERALLIVLDQAGVRPAMEVLDRLVGADEDVQRDSHVYAHGIGIAAYSDAETVSRTFAQCTPAYQSGCYHGVIQAYFADSSVRQAGLDSAALNTLCADLRDPEEAWVLHQCGHGMGHGLMAVHANHLLEALDDCDLLASEYEKSACWGGAFMENIVSATAPHHTGAARTASGDGHADGGHHGAGAEGDHGGHGEAAGDAGHDGHDGHEGRDGEADAGGHAHGAGEPFKALDADDPHYPCNVVKDHHRVSCYMMQTSAVLFANRGDFEDAAEFCTTAADDDLRDVCFVSLGRDAVAWANEDHRTGLRMCEAAPERFRPSCIVGFTKNLVDRTADPESGFAFCRGLEPGRGRDACYRAVGEEISLLDPTTAGRTRACAAAGEEHAVLCRRGAGVEPSGGG